MESESVGGDNWNSCDMQGSSQITTDNITLSQYPVQKSQLVPSYILFVSDTHWL